ncbi:MAG: high frequency lysogenization protein HflD [Buchnera aphidicola (Kaburagia rhusicola rhusicola)]
MTKNFYSIMLSLSGICQSVAIVCQLSQTGICNNDAFKISIDSILNINPETTLSVYGNSEKNLQLGITTLLSLLHNSNSYDTSAKMLRYILKIMILEKKLKKNAIYNEMLFQRISELIKKNVNGFSSYDILTDHLSEIYLNIISKLGSRIQVFGSPEILKNILIQNKIRCALFSGIRSAVLWRQVGGNFFQFIFFRNQIYNQANNVFKKFSS